MKFNSRLTLIVVITLILLGGLWYIHATPAIDAVSVMPPTIIINVPTVVVITATINDSSVIANSINLLRVGPTGLISILGQLHDDGKNGDAVAGDHVFTIQQTLNESNAGQMHLQVSAAFRGVLRRSVVDIPIGIINPAGLSLSAIASDSRLIIEGTVTDIRSAYNASGTGVFTYISIASTTVIKGTLSTSTVVVRRPGGTVGDMSQAVTGSPSFAVGEQVLLLLVGPDSQGQYSIPADALGKFSIKNDPIHGTVAVIDEGYKSMDLIAPLDSATQGVLTQSEQGALPLSDAIRILLATP